MDKGLALFYFVLAFLPLQEQAPAGIHPAHIVAKHWLQARMDAWIRAGVYPWRDGADVASNCGGAGWDVTLPH